MNGMTTLAMYLPQINQANKKHPMSPSKAFVGLFPPSSSSSLFLFKHFCIKLERSLTIEKHPATIRYIGM